jgi:hypothetical protein
VSIVSTEEGGPRRPRSPAYPAINLQEAIDRARKLYDAHGRSSASIEAILQEWGYKPRSGAGLVRVAALKQFGLLVDQGTGPDRRAKLTDLALTLLVDDPSSDEWNEAVREASSHPRIYRAVLEHFEGRLPNSDNALRSYLIRQRGYTEQGVRELIPELRATMDFAGLDVAATLSPREADKEAPKGGRMTPLEPGMQTLRAPLGGERAIEVQIPKRMTLREWELFDANLAAWRLATLQDEESEKPEE